MALTGPDVPQIVSEAITCVNQTLGLRLEIDGVEPNDALFRIRVKGEDQISFSIDLTRITGTIRATHTVIVRSATGTGAAVVPTDSCLLAAKVRALLLRRFPKPGDLFDIWFLLNEGVRLEPEDRIAVEDEFAALDAESVDERFRSFRSKAWIQALSRSGRHRTHARNRGGHGRDRTPLRPGVGRTRAYFTTKRWIELLRGLPPHGALLHSSAIQTLSGLEEAAARQAAWPLCRAGLLAYLGGGWYTHAFTRITIDEAAAVIVRPSYVSLESVLVRRGVTTQTCVDLTCVTTAATQVRATPLGEISYRSIAPSLYWGFDIKTTANGLYVFEAWPEKALLDLIYLSRRQGEPVWLDLDFNRLAPERLAECARKFPATVSRALEELRETRRVVA